jgi:hypothetical protein
VPGFKWSRPPLGLALRCFARPLNDGLRHGVAEDLTDPKSREQDLLALCGHVPARLEFQSTQA